MKLIQFSKGYGLGSLTAAMAVCVALSFTAGCKKKTEEAPSDAKGAIEKAGKAVEKAGDAAKEAGDAAKKAGEAVGDAAKKAE